MTTVWTPFELGRITLDRDLVDRLRRDAPLNEADHATFYGGGAQGYTDYSVLNGWRP
jgi:hypothetical protein